MHVPEMPARVLLDLRTDCNLKCPMCIVHGATDDPRLKAFLRRSMPLDKARQILDEIMHSRPLVQPNLWAEPLLAHDFQAHIAAMKERGLQVAFNTNGLLLTEKVATFLVEIEVDSVSISIDATTPETLKKVRGIDNLDKIHRAVTTLLKARGEKAKPRIGVTFTNQPENEHERAEFVERWAPIVDFVRVGELFKDGQFANAHPTGKRIPCPSLYSTLPIHVDGKASLCCLDGFGETDMGNVLERGVKDVWHGPEFTQARHYHETEQWDKVPMCKGCTRWASHVFEEVVEGDLLVRRSSEFTYYNRIDRLEGWSSELREAHQQAKV
jgi:MoaA/NifB/PqqE/SkfB family radical SAM enzyme